MLRSLLPASQAQTRAILSSCPPETGSLPVPPRWLSHTRWLKTETNENGVQLVWASTGTAGRVPIVKLCPAHWQDQSHPNEGLVGWHRGIGIQCDQSAPGAVLEGRRYYRSVFSLPYLNLSLTSSVFGREDSCSAKRNVVHPRVHQ